MKKASSTLLPPRWIAGLCLIVLLTSLVVFYRSSSSISSESISFPFSHAPALKPYVAHSPAFQHVENGLIKPEHTPVIGLIFYGRRDRVEILQCYLERNLVTHGGWLDEIHWVRNTADEEDLAYLRTILASNPLYKEIDISKLPTENAESAYENAWNSLRRGAIYIKIDDDVIYIADDTIPRLVTLRLENPNIFTASANVINSPLMGWVHYHSGAIHPYLPEFPTTKRHRLPKPKNTPWHYAAHPDWTGDADWNFTAHDAVPEHYHRWLRLPDTTSATASSSPSHSKTPSQIQRTPIKSIEYSTWGLGLRSWSIAAQEHYSFLENLALDPSLSQYKFAKLWTTDYERLSINLIAILADDVLDNLPMLGAVDGVEGKQISDEEWLTVEMPRKLGRSVVVDTDAVTVHYGFRTQMGLLRTDLLDRYRNFAKGEVCLGERV